MLPYRLAAVSAALVVFSGIACAQDIGPGAIDAYAVPAGEREADVWSPEAMRSAEMLALPQANPDAVRAFGRQRAAQGAPGQSEPEELSDQAGNERGSGNINQRPLYWTGRLFGKKPDGRGYRCSAQFIASDIVLTAAHCVRNSETGAFNRNVVFALGYEKGKYRQLYKATCLRTYKAWVQPSMAKYLYDYAMVRVSGKSVTGHLGTQWNWLGAYQSATKVGYPAGILDGEVIQVDRGPISVTDGIVEMRHGNPANQHGSSGGAWIGDYSSKSGKYNHVISVESFGYEGRPGVDYGPYFSEEMKTLLDRAKGPCN